MQVKTLCVTFPSRARPYVYLSSLLPGQHLTEYFLFYTLCFLDASLIKTQLPLCPKIDMNINSKLTIARLKLITFNSIKFSEIVAPAR